MLGQRTQRRAFPPFSSQNPFLTFLGLDSLLSDDYARIFLEDADPLGGDAVQLQQEMRAEALHRYGDLLNGSAPPPPFEPPVPWSAFLIARVDGQAVGCAALWPMKKEVAEIQRVFVAGPFRRRGIARRLLVELERRAVAFGYRALRLATGVRQPEAIALYESF